MRACARRTPCSKPQALSLHVVCRRGRPGRGGCRFGACGLFDAGPRCRFCARAFRRAFLRAAVRGHVHRRVSSGLCAARPPDADQASFSDRGLHRCVRACRVRRVVDACAVSARCPGSFPSSAVRVSRHLLRRFGSYIARAGRREHAPKRLAEDPHAFVSVLSGALPPCSASVEGLFRRRGRGVCGVRHRIRRVPPEAVQERRRFFAALGAEAIRPRFLAMLAFYQGARLGFRGRAHS